MGREILPVIIFDGMGQHNGAIEGGLAGIRFRPCPFEPCEKGGIRWRESVPDFFNDPHIYAIGLRQGCFGKACRDADAQGTA